MSTRMILPLLVAMFSPLVSAQAPTQPGPTPPALEPRGFRYEAGGRRDPFVSLLRRGGDTGRATTAMRPPGLVGLDTAEVSLKGTLASQGGYVAIVQGVDSRTYIVRSGERLRDGIVRAITSDALVILQQVDDPLSLEPQREVRKTLRQNHEAN